MFLQVFPDCLGTSADGIGLEQKKTQQFKERNTKKCGDTELLLKIRQSQLARYIAQGKIGNVVAFHQL